MSGVVVTKHTIADKYKRAQKKVEADEEETVEEEAPVPLVTHVDYILHSVFSNVEISNINNQQIYNSNGLYAQKSYISNNFRGAISEYKGVLHCEGYDYEEFSFRHAQTIDYVFVQTPDPFPQSFISKTG